jgi:hypothetical protein
MIAKLVIIFFMVMFFGRLTDAIYSPPDVIVRLGTDRPNISKSHPETELVLSLFAQASPEAALRSL